MLNRVKDDQRRIRQECIVDNLASVLLQKDQVCVCQCGLCSYVVRCAWLHPKLYFFVDEGNGR